MTRMLPPSTIKPMATGSYFERVMGQHFRRVNDIYRPRPRWRRSASIALQALGYAAVLTVLIFALVGFGD